MKCKRGDIAIMIKGAYVGHIVEVIEYDGMGDGDNWWYIKTSAPLAPGKKRWISRDRYMLPIRPGDLQEQDETEKELTV